MKSGVEQVATPQFSASRLTLARERRHCTKRDLALRCEVTSGAITQYENGEITPTPEALRRIALALAFPLGWFLSPELDLIDPSAPSFRARRSLSVGLQKKATRNGDYASAILLPDLEKRFRLPTVDVPDLSTLTPEEAARRLRSDWALGEGPLPAIVPLLESRGIFVFYSSEPNEALDAWSLWRNDRPFVMLNQRKPEGERERFDSCHELGHLVLHRHESVIEGRLREDEADRFASAFLIPDCMLHLECPQRANLREFLRLKKRWGMSVAALVYAGYHRATLSQYHYEMAFKEISRRKWRKGEPNSIARSQSKIHAFIWERLSAKGMWLEDYADHLKMPVEEIEELMPISVRYAKSSIGKRQDSLVNKSTHVGRGKLVMVR